MRKTKRSKSIGKRKDARILFLIKFLGLWSFIQKNLFSPKFQYRTFKW
jgi:hypothetical protein